MRSTFDNKDESRGLSGFVRRLWLRAPESEHALRLYTGAFMWLSLTISIVAISYVPDLTPENVNTWRIVVGIPALLFVIAHIPVGIYCNDHQSYWFTVVGAFIGFAVLGVLLQITPALWALLMALVLPAIFCGYFLRLRELIPLTVFATIVTLSALTSPFASDTAHLASRLAAYTVAMWSIVVALHLQKHKLQAALQEVRQKMYLDPLTGLANHRALRKISGEWLAGDANDEDSVVLMLVDLDNFKNANTLYGHLGGDRTLRAVAQELHRVLPAGAMAARVGGDEFAVISRVTDDRQAQELAGLLRGAVVGARGDINLNGVEIDASVGIARSPEDGTNLEQLLTAADAAMYAEKATHLDRAKAAAARPLIAAVEPTEPIAWEREDASPAAGSMARLRGLFASRTEITLYSTLGYLVSSLALAISMVIPGAYDDHQQIAVIALCTGPLWAVAVFMINPRNRFGPHIAIDIYTICALSLITALTGGFTSAAVPLCYLLVIHQAWFWGTRMLPWRLFTALLLVLFPFAYEGVGGGVEAAAQIASLYSAAATGIVLVLSLYFNQVSTLLNQRRARRLAATDPLTGAPNRRAFNEFVEYELARRTKEAGEELAIVMIDLDNFKDVNSVGGHRAGDELLCTIASALHDAARREDCVARVGGDEFAAVLPGAGVEGARALAERFVNAVQESAAGNPIAAQAQVTASAGFALCPLHGETLDELMHAADDALMSVKGSEKGTARVSRLVNAV